MMEESMFLALLLLINTQPTHLPTLSPKNPLNPIEIIQLAANKDASCYTIWVKEKVAPHIHKEHTEMVYIIEGSGVFKLDNKAHQIQPGTFLFIPPGVVHSVKVTSANPMKVLSIQTPEFKGVDRHFVTN